MKLNKIMASLVTVMGAQMLITSAYADRIIQRPTGAFYIVSDQEATKAFDRNNYGFFMLPPSPTNTITTAPTPRKSHKKKSVKKSQPQKKAIKKETPCVPVECPVAPRKPVTTVEPAESIFLRLEKNK